MKRAVRLGLWTLVVAAMLVLRHSPLLGEDRAAEPQGEEELEEFVPSERLPLDSAISFPVDI